MTGDPSRKSSGFFLISECVVSRSVGGILCSETDGMFIQEKLAGDSIRAKRENNV